MIKSATITQTGDLELEHNIDGNPDYGHLTVSLNLGEKFIADRGALAWMSQGMDVKARLLGGKISAFIRKLVGGESLFVGEFSHYTGGPATFWPSVPGEISHRKMSGDSFILTRRFVHGFHSGHQPQDPVRRTKSDALWGTVVLYRVQWRG